MKILIGCEESQAVTIAFRKRGFEAYSCDLQPCSGGHPEWHIQAAIFDVLGSIKFYTQDKREHFVNEWKACIFFPTCTHLASSGARWFPEKIANGSQQEAVDFFLDLAAVDCENIALENPIGIMSSKYRKPDQIIQPWQFGHGETKSTCLWLKGLPKLEPTSIVEGREPRIWKLPPSADRAKLRSKTYQGIADAMAQQWGDYLLYKDLL